MAIKRQQSFDGKAAELIVCAELLKRGITPFIPLLDDGIDIMVKSKNGELYEVQVKSNNSPVKRNQEWFVFRGILAVNPCLIYVLADLANDNFWIIPSDIVKQHGNQSNSQFDLHMKQKKNGMNNTRGELLKEYKNNWNIFTQTEE